MSDEKGGATGGRVGGAPKRAFTAQIEADRLFADIEAIAGFSESSPEVGYSRPTFSEPWRDARDYVIAQATAAGALHRIDAAGNVHIRSSEVGWNERVWLSGSHIDSVPSGGKYDGVMGVVIPLEIIRSQPSLPLELVLFAEEEGTTFGLGMLGSRSWCGALGAEELNALHNRHGESYLEAGQKHGVDPARLAPRAGEAIAAGVAAGDLFDPSAYHGLVEVHAEQGVSLWKRGKALAVVTRINGRRQIDIEIGGLANHAGSTFMPDRLDALAGAAEIVTSIEKLARARDKELPYTVATVGWLRVEPNASNVIPGRVRLKVDIRAQEEETLTRLRDEIRGIVEDVVENRALTADITQSEGLEPSPLDERVYTALRNAADRCGIEAPLVPSGALHDAAILASHLPTAMLFVASKDGISHNPLEFSRIDDIRKAAEVVAETVAASPTGVTDG